MNKQQYSIYRNLRVKLAKNFFAPGMAGFKDIGEAMDFYNKEMSAGRSETANQTMDWMVNKAIKHAYRNPKLQSAEEVLQSLGVDPTSPISQQVRNALDTKLGGSGDPGTSFSDKIRKYVGTSGSDTSGPSPTSASAPAGPAPAGPAPADTGMTQPPAEPANASSGGYSYDDSNPASSSESTPAEGATPEPATTGDTAPEPAASEPAPSSTQPTAQTNTEPAAGSGDTSFYGNVDSALQEGINQPDVSQYAGNDNAEDIQNNPGYYSGPVSPKSTQQLFGGDTQQQPASQPQQQSNPAPAGPGYRKEVGQLPQDQPLQYNTEKRPSQWGHNNGEYTDRSFGAPGSMGTHVSGLYEDPVAHNSSRSRVAAENAQYTPEARAQMSRETGWGQVRQKQSPAELAQRSPTIAAKQQAINQDINGKSPWEIAEMQQEWQNTYDGFANNMLRLHGDTWRQKGFTPSQINNYVHKEVMKQMKNWGIEHYPGDKSRYQQKPNNAPRTMMNGSQWSVN